VLNNNKSRFWVAFVSVTVLIGASIVLLLNPAGSEQDLSMLNIKNLANISYQRNELLVSRAPGKNEGFNVSAQTIAEYLDSVKWTEKKMDSPLELSADLQIEWNEDQELRFYESEPLLAMVRMNEQWRYYTIGRNDYEIILSIIETASSPQSMLNGSADLQDQTGVDVEKNLGIILSSPKTSSNPQDYINAHKDEYEYFFKYGGEDALQYMLTQFEAGKAEGLRGQIMMQLCQELLGARNNVTDESLSPQEWYNALSIQQEIMLPNYKYDGQDTIEKLVYDTEIERDSASNKRGGFTIVAPKVFGSYEEEDLLKVFVTTYSARYKLYGNTLSKEGGSIIPAAITYRKDNSGGYILEKYEQARDGSEFGPSIKKYCTMPVSKKEIKGLADKIFKHYSDYDDIRALQYDNLYKHLKKNGITDATLSNSQGEIKFSILF
jgi:hypothetical protein